MKQLRKKNGVIAVNYYVLIHVITKSKDNITSLIAE